MKRSVVLWGAAAAVLGSAGAHAQAADAEIFLGRVERSAGALRITELANVTARPGYDNQPHFTADGGALLYTRIGSDGQADIWRYDLRAGTAAALTNSAPESEYSATPLPDGGFAVIRVERDSTQRLWRFDGDGSRASLLFPDVKPVGYQAWLDGERAALFILGTPATLHVAVRGAVGSTRVAEDIGRALQTLPGGGRVSFVHRRADGAWISVYDPAAATPVRAVARVPADTVAAAGGEPRIVAGEYHAWLPDGTLLATAGARLFALAPGASEWQLLSDYREQGWTLSRIAVDRAGARVALVIEQRQSRR